jgi:hypothetical protein
MPPRLSPGNYRETPSTVISRRIGGNKPFGGKECWAERVYPVRFRARRNRMIDTVTAL